VELGDAEAIGILDDDDGRVRHVHPDLDHRRRHEDVDLATAEPLHRLLLLFRWQLAMEERDPRGGERTGTEPNGLLLRSARRSSGAVVGEEERVGINGVARF